MLCYMLCYVMLCYVMLCYVMLCYVMLCYVMLCYVMLCQAHNHGMHPEVQIPVLFVKRAKVPFFVKNFETVYCIFVK